MGYTASIVSFDASSLAVQSGPQMSAELVTVLNLAAVGDDLGGVFVWNPYSTATDDATNVFQPSSVTGAGRWIRVSGPPSGGGAFDTLVVTATTGNDVAVTATGHGSGNGVYGVGGSTGGAGLYGQGTAAAANGVAGVGGSSGNGVVGTGGGAATGVLGTGGATGAGVTGIGGATSGAGVTGTGTNGNALGVSGTGQGSAAGVAGTGGATGAGVTGTGGASSGAGGVFTGTAGNANGVTATGQGSGKGIAATGGGTNGLGGTFTGGATNGGGVEGYGTGTGAGVYGEATAAAAAYGVYGYASGTRASVFGESDGAGPAVHGDSTGGTGYGVVANADTTSPVRAALHITPQNAAPSSPAEGNVYSDSVTHALCHYDGSNWVETGARYATASIASADITGTSAGQLGHANGVVIVPSPGAGYAIEFLSGVVILDYDTAAYTGGGNVTFNYAGGGAAVSTVVSNANSVTGAADKVALVLATAPTNNQLSAATGLNLVSAAAPTQPGTAAGVLRVKVSYRVHATGL